MNPNTQYLGPTVQSRLRFFTPGRIAAWLALGLMLLVTLAPLWMVLKTALMPSVNLYTESATLWPSEPTLDNFQRVLGFMTQDESRARGGSGAEINFLRSLGNSLIFTFTIVLTQVSFAAMAAYAFARLRFPGRNTLFALFVGSMMVPGVVTFIPNFILIKELGLLNTMLGMVAPFCLMQGFSVFFLRQFFLSIPRELEEAALLDGASYFYIFIRVVLPLSITPLATIAMLTGINMWNEFFWPFHRRQRRGPTSIASGPADLQEPDTAGPARLDRPDGSHHDHCASDAADAGGPGSARSRVSAVQRRQVGRTNLLSCTTTCHNRRVR
jgi:multiple sugar transport system permease protein